MKNVVFVGIDFQNDFVSPKGALSVPGADADAGRFAEAITKYLVETIECCKKLEVVERTDYSHIISSFHNCLLKNKWYLEKYWDDAVFVNPNLVIDALKKRNIQVRYDINNRGKAYLIIDISKKYNPVKIYLCKFVSDRVNYDAIAYEGKEGFFTNKI